MTRITETTAPIAAGTWSADPVHSSIGFRTRHFGVAWLRGSFDPFEVQLVVGEDAVSEFSGSADVEGITFTNEQLHGHLMSPDFFDVQLHPTLSFTSNDVQLANDGSARVHGALTMKGTTRDVELAGSWNGPVLDMTNQDRIGLELTGELNRFDYEISWNASLAGGVDVVGPIIRFEAQLELVRS